MYHHGALDGLEGLRSLRPPAFRIWQDEESQDQRPYLRKGVHEEGDGQDQSGVPVGSDGGAPANSTRAPMKPVTVLPLPMQMVDPATRAGLAEVQSRLNSYDSGAMCPGRGSSPPSDTSAPTVCDEAVHSGMNKFSREVNAAILNGMPSESTPADLKAAAEKVCKTYGFDGISAVMHLLWHLAKCCKQRPWDIFTNPTSDSS